MAVSQRLRFEILKRDEHACKYCGRTPPKVTLTVDHVIPVTLGGSDDPANLVAACEDCNGGKSSVPPDAPLVADVAESAVKWAAAIQQVAEMRAAELDDHFQMMDWFYSEWNCWTNWRDDTYDADGAETSIPQFIAAGLTTQEIKHLIQVAMKSRATDKWKYFCGCCWKRIRQNQELASEIVGSSSAGAAEAKLFTVWTTEDIDEFVSRTESTAERWLTEESFESAHCSHNKWGDGSCGDPVCRVQRAEWLSTSAYHKMLKWDRDCAVMDAAEAALDG